MKRIGFLILVLFIGGIVTTSCSEKGNGGTTIDSGSSDFSKTGVDSGSSDFFETGAGDEKGLDAADDRRATSDAKTEADANDRVDTGVYPDANPSFDSSDRGDEGADSCVATGTCCECDTGPGCQADCICDKACGPLRCDKFILDLAFATASQGGLRGVGLSDANNGWAAGDNGNFYKLSEGEWELMKRPTDKTVQDVELSGPDTGWAVGVEILRLEGGSWNVEEDAPVLEHELLALDLADDDNGWAVGNSGLFVQLRDGVWSVSEFSHNETVYDVDLVDKDNGWAIAGTQAIELKDGEWSVYPEPITEYSFAAARAIELVDRDNGWAVGLDASAYRLSDGVWETALSTSTAGSLTTVALLDMETGYAAGNDGWAMLQGRRWIDGGCSNCNSMESAVFDMQIVETGGWAVGRGRGIFIQYVHGNWLGAGSMGHTGLALIDIALMGEDSAWVVGEYGALLRLQGREWTSFRPRTSTSTKVTELDIYAVDALSLTSGWAVGQDGVILRLDDFYGLAPENDPDWEVVTSPTDTNLYDVAIVSEDMAWAVGGYALGDGEILQYSEGKWVVHETVPSDELHAIAMVSEDSGWAVGGDPLEQTSIIMRFNNGKWEEVESPTTVPLWDISLIDESNGWAVGGSVSIDEQVQSSVVLRLQDGEWSLVPSDYESVMQSVAVGPDGIGWMVGTKQLLLALDGNDVKECPESLHIPQGGLYDLSSVALTDAGRARLVGRRGLRAHTR